MVVSYGFEPGAAKRLNTEERFVKEISPTLRANMGDNQISVAVCIENHPNDSRITVHEDGICQSLTGRMGTGGGQRAIGDDI